MTIQDAIIQTANKYLDKQEIPDNRGWYDKTLQAAMEFVGWRKGQHWCAYFMELVWREAYKLYFITNLKGGYAIDIDKLLIKLCSGNSQKTFKNFSNSDVFETGKHPAIGAAVIWKYSGVSGHTAAAVIGIDLINQKFMSIEGNSKNKVKLNFHDFDEPNRLGFIYPKEL